MTTTQQLGQYRQMAQFLSHLRVSGRGIPVNAAEALLLIAAGVDHVADLQAAMTDAQGRPLTASTAARLVALLRGRARYVGQRQTFVESPFALVEARPHPHRKGLQYSLTKNGRLLLDTFFPASSSD